MPIDPITREQAVAMYVAGVGDGDETAYAKDDFLAGWDARDATIAAQAEAMRVLRDLLNRVLVALLEDAAGANDEIDELLKDVRAALKEPSV